MQAEVYETMDEKKYPIPEEEGNVGMANEPVAEYKATGSGYMNTMEDESDENEFLDKISVGKFAFYTDDPDVFEARIAEIEADMERAEQGDESDWLTAEEFDAELRTEFPWLR